MTGPRARGAARGRIATGEPARVPGGGAKVTQASTQ
jgi:hypothetical protein